MTKAIYESSTMMSFNTLNRKLSEKLKDILCIFLWIFVSNLQNIFGFINNYINEIQNSFI